MEGTTIDDWVVELEAVYARHVANQTILAGFTYGAMTAFVAASHTLPHQLWLFSLSPYFSEDIPLLKLAYLRYIGKQRTERFWRVSFDKLASMVTCKTLIFTGDKEVKKYPLIGIRANAARDLLKNSKLIRIPLAGHDVSDPDYIAVIEANI